jgi:hypothetical protein
MATTIDEHATRTQLLIAGLTYRGFYAGIVPGGTSAIVRGDLRSGLEGILHDEWELVWGPATSRMLGDHFDASGMFLVRNRQRPAEHVLAVRGTNPVSLTDWGYGDFDVGTTVAWPFDAASHVSTSTAYGLVQLLQLAWMEDDLDLFVAGLAEKIRIPPLVLDGLRALGRRRDLGDCIRAEIANGLTTLLARVAVGARIPAFVGEFLGARLAIETKQLAWATPAPQGLVAHLAAAADVGPIELVVTGHSKGGALAPALALWLAETRRLDGGAGWDPSRRSNVRFAAFAGPTPGDEAFADRVLGQVGAGSYRVVNEHDIVPRAWSAEGLGAIAALYADRTEPLQTVLAAVVDALAGAGMDYRHVGPPTTVRGELDPRRSLGEEIVYQHMDAYLVAANADVDAIDLFVG